jgi:hypothetical protein
MVANWGMLPRITGCLQCDTTRLHHRTITYEPSSSSECNQLSLANLQLFPTSQMEKEGLFSKDKRME